MPRTASITRTTRETDISLSINLDGAGDAQLSTGVGFLDHMLDLLARHAMIDLEVRAKGDLHIDPHHTVEDVGIVLGHALEQALADKRGVARYGHFTLPMDETLASVALDLSGRVAFVYRVSYTASTVGTFPVELVEEFFKSIANTAKMNLHIHVPYGTNNHHIAEAIFKAFARALRMACTIDPRQTGIPSTKGSL